MTGAEQAQADVTALAAGVPSAACTHLSVRLWFAAAARHALLNSDALGGDPALERVLHAAIELGGAR